MPSTKTTYDIIKAQTGLSKTTLVRLADDKAELVGKTTLDGLCASFDCQPDDLFIYVSAARPKPSPRDI